MVPALAVAIAAPRPSRTPWAMRAADERFVAVNSIVEKTQRFHRDCRWVNNRWTYQRGAWRRDGDRQGWYHPRRKAWHYQF